MSDWTSRALCRHDPNTWTSGNNNSMALAAHMCDHCPVYVQCRDDLTQADPQHLRGVVQAGIIHNDAGKVSRWQRKAAHCRHCDTGDRPPCPNCWGPVPVSKGTKPRRFCTPACADQWWDRKRWADLRERKLAGQGADRG